MTTQKAHPTHAIHLQEHSHKHIHPRLAHPSPQVKGISWQSTPFSIRKPNCPSHHQDSRNKGGAVISYKCQCPTS